MSAFREAMSPLLKDRDLDRPTRVASSKLALAVNGELGDLLKFAVDSGSSWQEKDGADWSRWKRGEVVGRWV